MATCATTLALFLLGLITASDTTANFKTIAEFEVTKKSKGLIGGRNDDFSGYAGAIIRSENQATVIISFAISSKDKRESFDFVGQTKDGENLALLESYSEFSAGQSASVIQISSKFDTTKKHLAKVVLRERIKKRRR